MSQFRFYVSIFSYVEKQMPIAEQLYMVAPHYTLNSPLIRNLWVREATSTNQFACPSVCKYVRMNVRLSETKVSYP